MAVGPIALLLAGGTEVERRFQSIESCLSELGHAVLIVFVLLYATLISVLLSNSLFRVAAGAPFGYLDGLMRVVLGTLLASLLQFAIAQVFTTRNRHVIVTRSASGQSYGWVELAKFGALVCGVAAMVVVAHAAHKAGKAAMAETRLS